MNVDFITDDLRTGPILRIATQAHPSFLELIGASHALQSCQAETIDIKSIFPADNWKVSGLVFARDPADRGVLIEQGGVIAIRLTPATWEDIKDKLTHFLKPDTRNGDFFNWLCGPQSNNSPAESDVSVLITTKGGW